MSLRQIVEERSGVAIVSTIAAIAAGGAISGSYAAGVFDNPPPACYLSAPSSGATLTGAATLTAKCGGSTVAARFLVDGAIVATSSAAPFTVSWNSSAVANGSHSVQAVACDSITVCVNSTAVTVTSSNTPPNPPVNTVLPVITGGLTVGSVDTCSTGTWTGDTTSGFTYQWKDGSGSLTGQTAATYTLASGEIGASLHCTVLASGASGAVSADSAAVGPVVAAGSFVANVWVSATGADNAVNCVRGSAGGAPSAATACSTPQKACNLAQSGDVVGVIGGMYSGGFTLDNTCTQNITFENVPGAFVDFELYGSIAAANVTLQGDTVGQGVGFSLGQMQVTGTGVTWNNINLYCQSAIQATGTWTQLHSASLGQYACNDSLSVAAANFTWNGGDQEAWATCASTICTFTNARGNTNPNDDFVQPTASNVLIEHVTFKNHWGIGSTLHDEAWFLNGGDVVTFLDDKLLDCGPPVSTGYPVGPSCDTSMIFAGFTGTNNTTDHISMIQDLIAATSSVDGSRHVAFQYGHDKPNGHEYSFTSSYTTYDGGLTLCGTSAGSSCDAGAVLTGSGISIVGNVAAHGSSGVCFSGATYAHNTWFNANGNSATCNGTDQAFSSTGATTFWSAPGPPGYDYTPTATIQAKGENTVCATLPGVADINGKARPVSSPACDQGAVQH